MTFFFPQISFFQRCSRNYSYFNTLTALNRLNDLHAGPYTSKKTLPHTQRYVFQILDVGKPVTPQGYWDKRVRPGSFIRMSNSKLTQWHR